MIQARWMSFGVAIGIGLFLVGCGGGNSGSGTPPPTTTYVLTVNSTNPSSGVAITVSPADNSGATNGSTGFTRMYNSGNFHHADCARHIRRKYLRFLDRLHLGECRGVYRLTHREHYGDRKLYDPRANHLHPQRRLNESFQRSGHLRLPSG